VCKYLS
jgi:hypothetical protein